MSEETLVDAIARLRAEGYGLDFSAAENGQLRCRECGETFDPDTLRIEHTVRFEGASDPGDEAILLALVSASGCRGLYSAAFGTATPPDDSAVLARLAHRAADGPAD